MKMFEDWSKTLLDNIQQNMEHMEHMEHMDTGQHPSQQCTWLTAESSLTLRWTTWPEWFPL